VFVVFFSSGEWKINGSSPVATVGTDFVLTCTIPHNSTVPSHVAWLNDTDVAYIATNSCRADIDHLHLYIYTCNNNVFTLTIPGDGIDPNIDNGKQWRCSDGLYQNSDPFIITVFSKIYFPHLLCFLLYIVGIIIIASSCFECCLQIYFIFTRDNCKFIALFEILYDVFSEALKRKQCHGHI